MLGAIVGVVVGGVIARGPFLETIGGQRILIGYKGLDQKPVEIVEQWRRQNSGVGLEKGLGNEWEVFVLVLYLGYG